jgi:hypothetical protein
LRKGDITKEVISSPLIVNSCSTAQDTPLQLQLLSQDTDCHRISV